MHVQHCIYGYFLGTSLYLYLGPWIILSRAKTKMIEILVFFFFDDNIVKIIAISLVMGLNVHQTNTIHYNEDTKHSSSFD